MFVFYSHRIKRVMENVLSSNKVLECKFHEFLLVSFIPFLIVLLLEVWFHPNLKYFNFI